jgi:hypothetical protein
VFLNSWDFAFVDAATVKPIVDIKKWQLAAIDAEKEQGVSYNKIQSNC